MPVLIFIVVYGCSKDNEAPTFTKYNIAVNKPTNINASYDIDEDVVNVTWAMNYTANILEKVVGYEISISDSISFYKGNLHNTIPTVSTMTNYQVDAGKYVSSEVSLKVLYFNVSAIFDLGDQEHFVGSRADNPASVEIIRD